MSDQKMTLSRTDDGDWIDPDGQTYIRTDASAMAGFFVFVVGGGIGFGAGLFVGLWWGGALPL